MSKDQPKTGRSLVTCGTCQAKVAIEAGRTVPHERAFVPVGKGWAPAAPGLACSGMLAPSPREKA